MKNQIRLDLEVQKIIKNEREVFSENSNNYVSSILLFKDYINKLKDWKIILKKDYVPFGTSLNLNINNLIVDVNSSLAEDMLNYPDFRTFLSENYQINLLKGRYQNGFFIYMYVYWEVFKNELSFLNYSNKPNPYYGLMKMFKNDYIYRYDGINISGVTMRNSSINLRLPSLDDDFLDYIDSKCRLVGSDGIPNQERVDELWQEFQSLKQ